jgi:multidrug efflux system membrane fusion protein
MIKDMSVTSPASPDTTKGRPGAGSEHPASERTPNERAPRETGAGENAAAGRGTGAHPQPALSAGAPTGSRWTTVITLAILAALGVAAWHYYPLWWPRVSAYFVKSEPAVKKERVIPVVVARARRANMNIYLNGLGTVTALKTVTIRSRVEGELTNVTFTEGQMVHEGDLLAEIDPRPFEVQRDQAAGQLARDEATLKAAQLTLARLERLAQADTVSTQDVENQLAIVQQTEGIIRTDKAMVANAELQISYCRIVSPIDGRIGLRLVDKGNIVRANDPSGLAVINQLKPIAITFTISQDDIGDVQTQMARVKQQQLDQVTVDVYDRDFTNRLASGKLIAIDNQVDSTTGTLRLKAMVDDGAEALFPNQFVNTRLLVDTLRDAVVIPAAAVQRGPDSTFVYVVQGDDTVELRPVVTGPSEGTDIAITTGLEPDEVVVTEGLDKLQNKTKVAPRDASDKPGAKEASRGGRAAASKDAPSTDAPTKAAEGKSPTLVPPAEKPLGSVEGAKASP